MFIKKYEVEIKKICIFNVCNFYILNRKSKLILLNCDYKWIIFGIKVD